MCPDYKMKTCLRCERDFKPSSGVQQYCSPCKPLRDNEKRGEYRENNRADLRRKQKERWRTHNSQTRNSKLKSKYGITLVQYYACVARQNGCCLICSRLRKLVIDHCHRRKVFRGLLCRDCNIALGGFFDSTRSLLRAFVYLLHTGEARHSLTDSLALACGVAPNDKDIAAFASLVLHVARDFAI